MPGSYGLPSGSSPYAQPVIYIHPDSLAAAGYPMSSMGLAGYGGYASPLDPMYPSYNSSSSRDNARPGKS